jgi:hypothetical protein
MVTGMKTRQGFVSNSSSSSFVIDRKFLSPFQIEQIKDHIHVATQLLNKQKYKRRNEWDDEEKPSYDFGIINDYNAWEILDYEDETVLRGRADMDNFDMFEFLKAIGVNEEYIKYKRD